MTPAPLGPNRFAVALAPTKFEYFPAASDFDPDAVPNGVIASEVSGADS